MIIIKILCELKNYGIKITFKENLTCVNNFTSILSQ